MGGRLKKSTGRWGEVGGFKMRTGRGGGGA